MFKKIILPALILTIIIFAFFIKNKLNSLNIKDFNIKTERFYIHAKNINIKAIDKKLFIQKITININTYHNQTQNKYNIKNISQIVHLLFIALNQISINNLEITYNKHTINIKNLILTEHKDGYINAECQIEYRYNRVILEAQIYKKHIKTKIKKITIYTESLPVLKNIWYLNFIEFNDITINIKTNLIIMKFPHKITIDSLFGRTSISKKYAQLTLIYNIKDRTIKLYIKKMETKILKNLKYTFLPSDIIKELSNMIISGKIEKSILSYDKILKCNIFINKAALKIPYTDIIVKDIKSNINIIENNIIINTQDGYIQKSYIPYSKVNIKITPKKTFVKTDVFARINAEDINYIINKINVIDDTTKDTIKKFKILNGTLDTDIKINNYNTTDIIIEAFSKNIIAKIPYFNETIHLKDFNFNLKQNRIATSAKYIEAKNSTSIKSASVFLDTKKNIIILKAKSGKITAENIKKSYIEHVLNRLNIVNIINGTVALENLYIKIKDNTLSELKSHIQNDGILLSRLNIENIFTITDKVTSSDITLDIPHKITIHSLTIDGKHKIKAKNIVYEFASKRIYGNISLVTDKKLSHIIYKDTGIYISKGANIDCSFEYNINGNLWKLKNLLFRNKHTVLSVDSLIASVKNIKLENIYSKDTRIKILNFNRKSKRITIDGKLDSDDLKGITIISQPVHIKADFGNFQINLTDKVDKLNIKGYANFKTIKYKDYIFSGKIKTKNGKVLIENLNIKGKDKKYKIESVVEDKKDGIISIVGNIRIQKYKVSQDESFKLHKLLDKKKIKATMNVVIENIQLSKNIEATNGVGFISAKVSPKEEEYLINIKKINLCSLKAKTKVKKTKDQTTIWFYAKGKDAELDKLLKCTGTTKRIIRGRARYDIKIQTQPESGYIKLYSENGRIYELTALARLLEFINIHRIFLLEFPDLGKEGFKYKKLRITGLIKDGVIELKNCYIVSSFMKIFFEGKIYIRQNRIDITALVAPLRTVDIIISNIPVIGKILTGKSRTFISIPFKIHGDIDNPKITALPAQTIKEGIKNFIKRILKAPVYIIDLVR